MTYFYTTILQTQQSCYRGLIHIFCFFLLLFSLQWDKFKLCTFPLVYGFWKNTSFFFFGYSGYAHRIHELMAVSRELSVIPDRSLIKSHTSRNYISEANYIEFAGVKVLFSKLNA